VQHLFRNILADVHFWTSLLP